MYPIFTDKYLPFSSQRQIKFLFCLLTQVVSYFMPITSAQSFPSTTVFLSSPAYPDKRQSECLNKCLLCMPSLPCKGKGDISYHDSPILHFLCLPGVFSGSDMSKERDGHLTGCCYMLFLPSAIPYKDRSITGISRAIWLSSVDRCTIPNLPQRGAQPTSFGRPSTKEIPQLPEAACSTALLLLQL